MKLLIISLIIISSLFAIADDYKRMTEENLSRILDTSNLDGSILIYDSKSKIYYSNDFDWAERKFIPASTFKIPNTIIGLEIGILSDNTIFKWDGKTKSLKSWEQDLALKKAFRESCVPCYQENARNIGFSNMKLYLDKIKYPGMIFSDETIDKFWLEGDSKISQFEQIDFLFRYWNNLLPIKKETKKMMDELLLLENDELPSFYGKTGWAIRNGINIGWFVGFIESSDSTLFIALNVIPKNINDIDNFLISRMEATRASLKLFLKDGRNTPGGLPQSK